MSLQLPLLLFPVLLPAAFAVVTEIYDLPSYKTAPDCVQYCVYSASLFGVSSFLCYQDFPATCLCSSGLGQSSEIKSFASKCVLTSCADAVAATGAPKIWDAYCTANDVLQLAATETNSDQATSTAARTASPSQTAAVATAIETSAPMTLDVPSGSTTSVSTASVSTASVSTASVSTASVSTASASDSSSSPNSNSVSLPLWMLISMAVAVPSAVILLIGLGAWCFFRRRAQCRRPSKSLIGPPIFPPIDNTNIHFPPSHPSPCGSSTRPYSPSDFWKKEDCGSSYMMTPVAPLSTSPSPCPSPVRPTHRNFDAPTEWPLTPAAGHMENGEQSHKQQYFELPGPARAELE